MTAPLPSDSLCVSRANWAVGDNRARFWTEGFWLCSRNDIWAGQLVMALSKLSTRPFDKYEPLPRFGHISSRVGSKVVVQGGWTKDFLEKTRQHLSSVVEIFDPYSELWEQRKVTGDAPSPGTRDAASASLHNDLFSFGGGDGRQYFNTVHRLDTEKLCWSQVSPQNADGAPMPKTACGMIAFGNSLGVFGGYGLPRGPTEPQSFIKSTGFTNGSGWTNEFHIYNLSEGNMR